MRSPDETDCPVPSRLGLALVLLVALGTGLWKCTHTLAVSEDTVLFVRFARQLGGAEKPQYPWGLHEKRGPAMRAVLDDLCWCVPAVGVIETFDQHPGYPLLLLAGHRAVGRYLGGEEVWQWVRAGQLVSLIAGLMLVATVYALGRRLLGPTAALVGALCLAVSPMIAGFRADALSDMPALALFALSTLFAVSLVREARPRAAALCGLFAGLGYWVRPEAAQTALFVAVWLLARWGWRRRVEDARILFAVAVPVVFLCAPYMLVRGSVLTKSAAVLKTAEAGIDATVAHEYERRPGRRKEPTKVTPLRHLLRGVRRFADGWAQDVGRFALPFVLLGLWCGRRTLWSDPGQRLLAGIFVLNALVLPGVLYYRKGYLDPRHLLPVAVVSVPWLWAGLLEAARGIAAVLRRIRVALLETMLAGAGVAALVVLSAPGLFAPLHGERFGHRLAGACLRRHAESSDEILDPGRMAGFFAGLDGRNRWPHDYPPPGSAVIEGILGHYPRANWLVLSDRLVPPGEVEDWNEEAESVRLVEVQRFPLSRGSNNRWDVRVYRVEPLEGPRP